MPFLWFGLPQISQRCRRIDPHKAASFFFSHSQPLLLYVTDSLRRKPDVFFAIDVLAGDFKKRKAMTVIPSSMDFGLFPVIKNCYLSLFPFISFGPFCQSFQSQVRDQISFLVR